MPSTPVFLSTCFVGDPDEGHELVHYLYWLGHSQLNSGTGCTSSRCSLALFLSPDHTFTQPPAYFPKLPIASSGGPVHHATVDPMSELLAANSASVLWRNHERLRMPTQKRTSSSLLCESLDSMRVILLDWPKMVWLEQSILSLRSRKCLNLQKEVAFSQPVYMKEWAS